MDRAGGGVLTGRAVDPCKKLDCLGRCSPSKYVTRLRQYEKTFSVLQQQSTASLKSMAFDCLQITFTAR